MQRSFNICKSLWFTTLTNWIKSYGHFNWCRKSFWQNLASVSEKAMALHSNTLAWKIPWMAKPDRLQSMGSLRFGHRWATLLSLFCFMHWRRKWQPIPVFLPEESQGRWAALYGVTQSRTRLKLLSSSSSSRRVSPPPMDPMGEEFQRLFKKPRAES